MARLDPTDELARVTLQLLLGLLTRQHLIGRCCGHMASIEFQTRGLPHVHIH